MGDRKSGTSPVKIIVGLHLYIEQDGQRTIAGSRLLKGDDAPKIQFAFPLEELREAKEHASRLQKHVNQNSK